MNTPKCQTCVHYRRHYLLDSQGCTATNCGHCVFPRTKHREPGHPACSKYILQTVPPALTDWGSVVHFLITELLQYILSLGLPPTHMDNG